VFSSRFDDPDAFGVAVRGADVDFVPLPSRRYRADLVAVPLGEVRLQQSSISPNRARGGVDPGSASLLVLTTQAPEVLVNGRPFGPAQMAVLRPGAEFQGVARDGLGWASLTLRAGAYEDLCLAWQLPSAFREEPVLAGDPASVEQLRQAIDAVAGLATSLPDALADDDVRRALGGAVIDLLGAARFGPEGEVSGFLRTAEAMRIVARAEDYLVSKPSQPIYNHDLSRALGVSERGLFAAFAAVCGVSPQAYLKMRRLLLVRRALRVGGGEAGLVKSVALAQGFWHLGHFARDYRLAFGESPSHTLRRSRETPAAPGIADVPGGLPIGPPARIPSPANGRL